MKGGFGRFLTFILGLVVGVLLLGGTIAGVAYYAVAGVTINDVEDYTGQKFNVIDENAEIRGKTILDIYDLVKGGNLKETTIGDAKRVFGIDIVSVIEKSAEITIDEKSREKLSAVKVAEIAKGDNLKIILNCIKLGDVFKKAGIDTADGLASKPIIKEHIDDPVIDGFNAILKSFEINEMTVAEIQYLLGFSFGEGGVLDALENVKIGNLNTAINDVRFEKILPDFDRDLYAMWDYNNDRPVTFGRNISKLGLNTLINEDGTSDYFEYVAAADKASDVTYYAYDEETGTLKISEDGNWKVKDGKELPSFKNRYDKTGAQNRFGIVYVIPVDSTGAEITERFSDSACTTPDESGLYYYDYHEVLSGDGNYYRVGAAIRTKIAEATDTEPAKYAEVIEWRRYVEKTEADFFEAEPWKTYGYSTTYPVNDEELREKPSSTALYALVHVGKSEPVLKALADETLNTIDGAIGDMKLGQVIEITDDSADFLKALKDSRISDLDEDVKKVKIGDIMKVTAETTVAKKADGEYIALPSLPEGKEYKGTFITAKDGDKTVYLVKYKEGLSSDFGDRYEITEKASNGVVVALAEKTVGDLQTSGIDSLIDLATLSDVMDVDGDVFVEDASGEFILDLDENDLNGFFRLAADGETPEYRRVYVGGSNAVVKKLATVGVNGIASRIDAVVDSTLLKEVVDVKERYALRKATAEELADASIKKYYSLKDVYEAAEYEGAFNIGYDVDDADKADIKFVQVKGGATLAADVIQYVVVEKASSGVLVGMQNKTIGSLSTGVDDVVNNAKLQDVLEISGKVYVKVDGTGLSNVAYLKKAQDLSNTVIGEAVAYYKDGNLFLEAGFVRSKSGEYVYIPADDVYVEIGDLYAYDSEGIPYVSVAGKYFKYNDEYKLLDDYKRYKFDGKAATEYYACVYDGDSDEILSKMATISVQDLADSATMDKIMQDMRLGEMMKLKDTKSILYGLDNCKLSSLEVEVSDKIKVATLRQLNDWGDLGLTMEQLDKTVKGTTVKAGDMLAVEFIKIALALATE